jgi:aspartate aminotransferase
VRKSRDDLALVFAPDPRFINPCVDAELSLPFRNSVNIKHYEEKRDLFYRALKEFGYDVVRPQGAFYLFPKAPIEDDVAFVRELQAKRILTVPGRGFGRKGYFRIAYCVEKKMIEGALPGFKEVAEKYGLVKKEVSQGARVRPWSNACPSFA